MARNGVLPSIESPWTSESPHARRLADALRSCRLSILCGEHDDARAGLIVTGLLPLLRRRVSDLAMLAPRERSSMILPFPERRSHARARLAELVVFNDAWDDASPAVHHAIDDALRLAGVVPERDSDTTGLADRVRTLGDRHGTRMLFVFDRFDVLLDQCGRRSSPNLLLDELALLLNRRLPANVLVSMRSPAAPLLERLRERGSMIEAESFTMPPEPSAAPPVDVERASLNVHRLQAAAQRADDTEPQHDDDRPGARDETYADIATFVERSRERGGVAVARPGDFDHPPGLDDDGEALPDETMPRRPSPEVVALVNELTSLTQPGARALAPGPQLALTDAAPPRHTRWPWALATAAVFVLVAVFVSLHGPQPAAPDSPIAAALPADPSAPPATSDALAPLEIAVESEDRTLPTPVAELLRAVSNTAAKATPVPTLSPATSSAPVSIVRYDALQATALRGGSTPISVIAPLYTEELYVIVRADSPLRYIHQLRGQRINIGPANGARALTALELYERMFGKPLPAAQRDARDAAAALQRLAARQPTFDAIVLVQPEPSDLWNSLAPETRRELRLLSLDPQHPASQRALQEYLPATLHERATSSAAASTIPTLASMAFLVVNGTPNTAQREAIVSLARSFCGALPALKRSGHPKWREVRAGQQLETPWMPETSAASAWSACADAGPSSPSSPSSPPQGAR